MSVSIRIENSCETIPVQHLSCCFLMAGIGLVVPANAKMNVLGPAVIEPAVPEVARSKVCFITSTPIKYEGKYDSNPGQHVYLSPITTVTLIGAELSAASLVIASRKANLCFYH